MITYSVESVGEKHFINHKGEKYIPDEHNTKKKFNCRFKDYNNDDLFFPTYSLAVQWCSFRYSIDMVM